MKYMLTVALIALFGLTFWAYRSRIRFALKTATILYIVLIGVNLVRLANDPESGQTVIIVLVAALALWGALRLAVTLINRRGTGSHPT